MPDDPTAWGDDITASPTPTTPHTQPPLVPPPPSQRPPASIAPPPSQGTPIGASPSAGSSPPAAATARPQPSPGREAAIDPEDGTGWSWRSTAITLGALLVIGVGAFWYVTRETPVAIEVDGARPSDGAGCWFAPPDEENPVSLGPQLACGPVLLGVSGTTKPWVLGTVSYTTSGSGDESTGTFGSLDGVGDPDTGDFARPDGRDVPATSDLEPATVGIRAEDGRRLVGDQAAIDAADEAFADAPRKPAPPSSTTAPASSAVPATGTASS